MMIYNILAEYKEGIMFKESFILKYSKTLFSRTSSLVFMLWSTTHDAGKNGSAIAENRHNEGNGKGLKQLHLPSQMQKTHNY